MDVDGLIGKEGTIWWPAGPQSNKFGGLVRGDAQYDSIHMPQHGGLLRLEYHQIRGQSRLTLAKGWGSISQPLSIVCTI